MPRRRTKSMIERKTIFSQPKIEEESWNKKPGLSGLSSSSPNVLSEHSTDKVASKSPVPLKNSRSYSLSSFELAIGSPANQRNVRKIHSYPTGLLKFALQNAYAKSETIIQKNAVAEPNSKINGVKKEVSSQSSTPISRVKSFKSNSSGQLGAVHMVRHSSSKSLNSPEQVKTKFVAFKHQTREELAEYVKKIGESNFFHAALKDYDNLHHFHLKNFSHFVSTYIVPGKQQFLKGSDKHIITDLALKTWGKQLSDAACLVGENNKLRKVMFRDLGVMKKEPRVTSVNLKNFTFLFILLENHPEHPGLPKTISSLPTLQSSPILNSPYRISPVSKGGDCFTLQLRAKPLCGPHIGMLCEGESAENVVAGGEAYCTPEGEIILITNKTGHFWEQMERNGIDCKKLVDDYLGNYYLPGFKSENESSNSRFFDFSKCKLLVPEFQLMQELNNRKYQFANFPTDLQAKVLPMLAEDVQEDKEFLAEITSSNAFYEYFIDILKKLTPSADPAAQYRIMKEKKLLSDSFSFAVTKSTAEENKKVGQNNHEICKRAMDETQKSNSELIQAVQTVEKTEANHEVPAYNKAVAEYNRLIKIEARHEFDKIKLSKQDLYNIIKNTAREEGLNSHTLFGSSMLSAQEENVETKGYIRSPND